MLLLNSWISVTATSVHLLNDSISFFPPGDDKRSRGRGDDPWWGLRLHGGLRVRLSVHHQEDPQPHPGDAQTPPHAATGGDVLAAPEDGRLLPHLLPARRQAELQGHVPDGLREVLGRSQAPSLGLSPPVGRWQNHTAAAQSASHQRGWHHDNRAADQVGALAHTRV